MRIFKCSKDCWSSSIFGVLSEDSNISELNAIVNPTLRTTRLYRGSFEIVSGSESYARVNTSTGYYDCKEKRHYYYLTNRQGSVMAVIDDQGTTVQRTGLYPSGTPFVLPSDIRLTPAKNTTPTLTPATDRLHIGNRWLGHSGLNRYDNTARLHDPLLCRFDTPDPLATKFPSLNPWTHTAANPANAIDPNGMAVFFMNSRDELVRVGEDGVDDGRMFVVNKSLGKHISKLTEKGEYYTGNVGNNKEMAEITNITDFNAIDNAIADANSDGNERGMHKDRIGKVHLWDKGSGATDNDDGTKTNKITPFIGEDSRQADTNALWYMHIHPNVKGYARAGTSIPSSEDLHYDEDMRIHHYNGTTFVIGGRDLKVTFYHGVNRIMSVPLLQLKKILIN